MQESLPQIAIPSFHRQQTVLPFGEFLKSMFEAFSAEGVRPCIMRNYEGFPDHNIGRDVDFLIPPSQLASAIRALGSIQGARIVGYLEYPSVALVYVNGVSPAPDLLALEIDFSWRLDWKGLPFMATEETLKAAIPHTVGNISFLALSPVHEAILSLLTCLIGGGFVKEKYFPKVQQTFASDKTEVLAALSPQFGSNVASRLVNCVIDGERGKIVDCVGSLRAALALRNLLRWPLRSISGIVGHYVGGFAVHYSPKTLESLCILGADGCGKTAIIETLIPMLQSSAMVVESRHPGSRLPLVQKPQEVVSGAGSQTGAARRSFVSGAKAVLSLLDEWLSQIGGKASLTLRIFESRYYDLSINSRRYGYDGPAWLARFVAKLLPSPDLWILVDAPADVIQRRNPQLTLGEAQRQIEAYRTFIKTKKRYIVLDASKPSASVTEEAYLVIIDTLAQRTDRHLKSRFDPHFHSDM